MTPIARPDFETAVRKLGVMDALRAYDPHTTGTPPLGLETKNSDIDVLCHAPDADAFLADILRLYGAISGFRVWQWIAEDRPMIAAFRAFGWDFEFFASPCPVASQYGWRHFQIEKRLLRLGGENFKNAVMSQRRRGVKTEPAFWLTLKQDGDAYRGLLTLEKATDEALCERLVLAGFSPNAPVAEA